MLFMFVFQHKHLTVKEIFCGIVAVAGVVLVVTGGSFKNFNVSGIGFWAGIGSGITGAFYVLLPQKFIARVGSGLATSWALLLTGVSVTLFSHFGTNLWTGPFTRFWLMRLLCFSERLRRFGFSKRPLK